MFLNPLGISPCLRIHKLLIGQIIPYLKFSFHILVEDEVTETHEIVVSNIWGIVVSFLVHVVPPNSDYTSPLISPGLGYSSKLDGTVFLNLTVKYCSCSRSPLCKISGRFRGNFKNTCISDLNNFSVENAYYRPTLPFSTYFIRSHWLTAWNRLYNPWSNY